MPRPKHGRRTRALFPTLVVPLVAAGLIACESPEPLQPEPGPSFAYANGGEPELAPCYDPTPDERWTAIVSSAGGTFSMGPNTLVVPPNAVSTTALISLRELDQYSLRMRVTSTEPINANLEVAMSTDNCETVSTQTVWLFDETQQEFEDLVDSDPEPDDIRFWTIYPGVYALAN